MSDSQDTANLLYIVKNQTKSEIAKLVQEKKDDLHKFDEKTSTVLHLIFQNDIFTEKEVIELIEPLLDLRVNPKMHNNNQLMVIHFAIARRWKGVINLFIGKLDDHTIDEKDNAIVHFFIDDERMKIVKLMDLDDGHFEMSNIEEIENDSAKFLDWLIKILKGFNFVRRNKEGRSALHLSIEYNLQHITLAMLKHTRDVNFVDEYKRTLLHLYFEKNNSCKYEYRNHELKKSRYSAYSSRYATKIVKVLLDKGCSAAVSNAVDRTALQLAIECKEDISVIELLLDHRLKNCEKKSETTIFELMKIRQFWDTSSSDYAFDVLRTLRGKGVDMTARRENGLTAVHCAYEGEAQGAVQLLYVYDIDISVITGSGENPFHALARNEYRFDPNIIALEMIFKLLVTKGCDINEKNRSEETPLHVASREENLAMVYCLVNGGAEVNCRDRKRETPLHMAAEFDRSHEIAELLLQKGADVNCKDVRGRRPLYLAAAPEGHGSLVPVLLEWHACPDVYHGNESPLSEAILGECWSNAKEMLAYGADINDARIVALLRTLREEPAQDRAVNDSESLVMQHWVKLRAATFPCPEQYAAFFNRAEYHELHQQCLKEIETLKSTFIAGGTSVFAFLRMHFDSRRRYINNVQLQKLVNSAVLDQQFPDYAVVIRAAYRETVRRRSFLELAKEAWLTFADFVLPDVCINLIFAYLDNKDLLHVIKHDDDL